MENAPTTIAGAFTSWLTDFATLVLNGLIQVLPVALPILGTLILVAILVRVIQRVTGRRA